MASNLKFMLSLALVSQSAFSAENQWKITLVENTIENRAHHGVETIILNNYIINRNSSFLVPLKKYSNNCSLSRQHDLTGLRILDCKGFSFDLGCPGTIFQNKIQVNFKIGNANSYYFLDVSCEAK